MAKKQETKEVQMEQPVQEAPKTPEKVFSVSEEFRGAVRKLLGAKPFVQVAGVITLLDKETMLESEINAIINTLGNFPYDEVANVFGSVKGHVKEIEQK